MPFPLAYRSREHELMVRVDQYLQAAAKKCAPNVSLGKALGQKAERLYRKLFTDVTPLKLTRKTLDLLVKEYIADVATAEAIAHLYALHDDYLAAVEAEAPSNGVQHINYSRVRADFEALLAMNGVSSKDLLAPEVYAEFVWSCTWEPMLAGNYGDAIKRIWTITFCVDRGVVAWTPRLSYVLRAFSHNIGAYLAFIDGNKAAANHHGLAMKDLCRQTDDKSVQASFQGHRHYHMVPQRSEPWRTPATKGLEALQGSGSNLFNETVEDAHGLQLLALDAPVKAGAPRAERVEALPGAPTIRDALRNVIEASEHDIQTHYRANEILVEHLSQCGEEQAAWSAAFNAVNSLERSEKRYPRIQARQYEQVAGLHLRKVAPTPADRRNARIELQHAQTIYTDLKLKSDIARVDVVLSQLE